MKCENRKLNKYRNRKFSFRRSDKQTEPKSKNANPKKLTSQKWRNRFDWRSPRISGAIAGILLFAILLTGIISTIPSARAEENAVLTPSWQLAKEYIYAGGRMLAIEDYGVSSSTPTPTPTETPTPTPELKPDLVITDFSISPSPTTEGDTVNFSVTIKNQGQAATSNSWTAVLYKVDGISPGMDGTWAGTTTSLAPDQSITFSTSNIPWTATVGSHTLTALVDDQNIFDESDETNNTATLNINVNPAPTPTPTPTATPTPTPSETYTLSVPCNNTPPVTSCRINWTSSVNRPADTDIITVALQANPSNIIFSYPTAGGTSGTVGLFPSSTLVIKYMKEGTTEVAVKYVPPFP